MAANMFAAPMGERSRQREEARRGRAGEGKGRSDHLVTDALLCCDKHGLTATIDTTTWRQAGGAAFAQFRFALWDGSKHSEDIDGARQRETADPCTNADKPH